MAANFLMKCRFEPVGPEGPLVPSLQRGGPSGRVLELEAMDLVNFSTWEFTLDGSFIVGLQDDGGIDRITSYYRMGAGLNSGVVRPRAGEQYFRLFVEPGERSFGNPTSNITFERVGDVGQFRFTGGAIERQYLIGPGVTALAGAGRLRGIDIDLRGFMDRKRV